jgi:hypothetical protein
MMPPLPLNGMELYKKTKCPNFFEKRDHPDGRSEMDDKPVSYGAFSCK